MVRAEGSGECREQSNTWRFSPGLMETFLFSTCVAVRLSFQAITLSHTENSLTRVCACHLQRINNIYTKPDRKWRCDTLWDVGSGCWVTVDCIWANVKQLVHRLSQHSHGHGKVGILQGVWKVWSTRHEWWSKHWWSRWSPSTPTELHSYFPIIGRHFIQ